MENTLQIDIKRAIVDAQVLTDYEKVINIVIKQIPKFVRKISLDPYDKYLVICFEFNKDKTNLDMYYFTVDYQKKLTEDVLLKESIISNKAIKIPEEFFRYVKKEKKNIAQKIGAIPGKSRVHIEPDMDYSEWYFKI